MTLKQEVQRLVEAFPDDSTLLVGLRERLLMDDALREAQDDLDAGRVFEAEAFMAKVEQRWPAQPSE